MKEIKSNLEAIREAAELAIHWMETGGSKDVIENQIERILYFCDKLNERRIKDGNGN